MAQLTRKRLEPFISCFAGRRNDYALQQVDGRYLRSGEVLTYAVLYEHLQGLKTIGVYVINEQGFCHFAMLDSDQPDGLSLLALVQAQLAARGIVSYLERSRRGAHLWVFLVVPTDPAQVRRFLLPYCPAGVEFYPKQDTLSAGRPYGSLVRLPLGVHRLTKERYPFVACDGEHCISLFFSLAAALDWFATVERVAIPTLPTHQTIPTYPPPVYPAADALYPSKKGAGEMVFASIPTIADWCRGFDPVAVIGCYVALDVKGMGCCPFGWHHDDGIDSNPSFWVYQPTFPDLCCWYCHVWQQGGSLFDFLRYYYALEPRELWHRILSGAQF